MSKKMKLAHMAAIVESSNGAIISQTLEGVVASWNKGAEKLYGYTAEEVVGKPMAILQHPVSGIELPQFLERVQCGKPMEEFETTHKHKDGSPINVSLSVSPVYDAGGSITHFAIIARDISKIQRSEKEKRLLLDIFMAVGGAKNLQSALEVALQKVCEATGWVLGIAWVPSADGTVLECRAAWQVPSQALANFREESAGRIFAPGIGLPGRVWSSGKPAWIQDVTGDANFPRAPFAKKAGIKAGMGIPVFAGTSIIAVIEFFVFDVRGTDEDLIEVVSAVAAQLGASILRRRGEENLEERERQLAAANLALQREVAKRQEAISALSATLESTTDGILVVNQNGKIVNFNQNFVQIWGIEDEILNSGDDDRALGAVLKQLVEPEAFLKKVRELYASPETVSRDEIRFKDGRLIERDSRPLRVGNGIVGRVWSFRDVTEKNRARMEIDRIAMELAISNRDLEQFAYVASHDLQEPLRMVASYTELLARRYRGKMGSEADEFIDYIIDGSTRLRDMIKEILAYSRIGKQDVFEPTDCAIALNQSLSNLQSSVVESGAVITASSMPRLSVNPELLVHLFQNLISNAIKYRGTRSPRIRIGAKHVGAEYLFSIQDNGIGFDMKYADRVFVLFQRLHARSEYPGSGIGLAFCKKIVEHHGGRIWVESVEGQGSTFFFTLPESLESCGTGQGGGG